MYSCGPPHMDVQKQDDHHELTYSNYVRTRDVTLKTSRRRWMIGRSGERGSGISVLAARHDDDDDDDLVNLPLIMLSSTLQIQFTKDINNFMDLTDHFWVYGCLFNHWNLFWVWVGIIVASLWRFGTLLQSHILL